MPFRDEIVEKAVNAILADERIDVLLTPPELIELERRVKAIREAQRIRDENRESEEERVRHQEAAQAQEQFIASVPVGLIALMKYVNANLANDIAYEVAQRGRREVCYPLRLFPDGKFEVFLKSEGFGHCSLSAGLFHEVERWLRLQKPLEKIIKTYWAYDQPLRILGERDVKTTGRMDANSEFAFTKYLSGRMADILEFQEFLRLCRASGFSSAFSLSYEYRASAQNADGRSGSDSWFKELVLRVWFSESFE